jgi:pyruvate/2-oxoglutarate dehydrogenase complex dihydrolipoamide dehydrogenase (E3) component
MVTLVENSDRLSDRQDPKVGEIIQEILEGEGADVHVDRRVVKPRRDGEDTIVTLDDGEEVKPDILVMVASRTPCVEHTGLRSVGAEVDQKGLPINERCQINGATGLRVVGAATGVSLFTDVAQYQTCVVADSILDGDRRGELSRHRANSPTDPEITATGMTEEEAQQKGIDVALQPSTYATRYWPVPLRTRKNPGALWGL